MRSEVTQLIQLDIENFQSLALIRSEVGGGRILTTIMYIYKFNSTDPSISTDYRSY